MFQFILRVSVVNSYLAYCYFQDKPNTFLMDFVDVLASELCWPKRQSASPKRRKSNGEVSPKVCSMESVKEMFPSINSKGSGRCKVVGPNGAQRLTTFAGNVQYLGMNRSQSFFTCVGPPYCETWGYKHLQSSAQLSAQEE